MADSAAARRTQMVARLRGAGAILTPAIEAAMRQVPRHRFVPEVEDQAAYLDEAVMVKYAADGRPISSLSQPTIVAIMLERLQVAPGHHVLEVGTGTGYNAALLAELAGADGHVVTVELEPDLARRAAQAIAGIGPGLVEVVIGDGRQGYAPGAPYDRVIVTTGARWIAQAWINQLATGGRLVLPLVDHRGLGLVVVYDEAEGRLRQDDGIPCGFIPIRHSPLHR